MVIHTHSTNPWKTEGGQELKASLSHKAKTRPVQGTRDAD